VNARIKAKPRKWVLRVLQQDEDAKVGGGRQRLGVVAACVCCPFPQQFVGSLVWQQLE
jgi:hypothetical protein